MLSSNPGVRCCADSAHGASPCRRWRRRLCSITNITGSSRSGWHVIPIDYIFVQDRSHFAGWLICICVQPALIEELFFRYLAFGSLRAVMGGHAVVWVTAVMFASAHIGVVLSLPVLFVLGLLLGYARLASGGMLLPVVLHFLHNLCVIALHS